MNNFVILFFAIMVLFIGYCECYNPEDMALFFFACLITIPTILVSIVGIIIGKNFFEM